MTGHVKKFSDHDPVKVDFHGVKEEKILDSFGQKC
jgi:hypothetical protein